MGVNFYANSRRGKPFVPIEKWTHLEGPGGIVNTKVDTLSARVWVELIKAFTGTPLKGGVFTLQCPIKALIFRDRFYGEKVGRVSLRLPALLHAPPVPSPPARCRTSPASWPSAPKAQGYIQHGAKLSVGHNKYPTAGRTRRPSGGGLHIHFSKTR